MTNPIHQRQQTYLLPSHPSYKVLDRFSILPDEQADELLDSSGYIPFWPLLQYLLIQCIQEPNSTAGPHLDPAVIPHVTDFQTLTFLLDTITLTIRGTTHPARIHGSDKDDDYRLLREAIDSRFRTGEHFSREVWPRLVRVALEMPDLFPSHDIPCLGSPFRKRAVNGAEEDTISLSRRQAACLVVHQFLRTLRAPAWKDEEEGLHEFGLWYSGAGQRQESAARAYLAALMAYFEEVVCREEEEEGWVVEYTLRTVDEDQVQGLLEGEAIRLADVEVEIVERFDTSPASLGVPGGAAVVAANKVIGFGQSATQEEVHVGSTPEACPAVLFTPPLEDDQVLIVRGAQGMVNITGARRDIQVEALTVPDGGVSSWRTRTMLFMDALELDMADPAEGLPDLLPGNLDRELRKAYTTFSSGHLREIRTGLWGCGAFCGDPGVKMLVLWLAASLARTKPVVVCDGSEREFAEEFLSVVGTATAVLHDAAALWQLLGQMPRLLVRGETLPWIAAQLEGCC
ncbi:hypothetical protein VTJ49DRAFT_5139 [Mycothermus thermophilus]|uniref:poly(ADP-ribose) glycohydrolase n=1 Tax=Humicola insolens TaxID=85995 RepID=A0ABR3V415_HUMIN